MKEWISVDDRLPLEGVEVDTKIGMGFASRNQQHLRRKNNLWFFPDMSMYVYYMPTHWKTITEDNK